MARLAEYFICTPSLTALQRGIALTLPLVMLGALALLLQFPPFPQLKSFMTHVFGPHYDEVLSILVSSTFGISGLLALAGHAYVYTNLRNSREKTPVANPMLSIIVAVACFFVVVAPTGPSNLMAALSITEGLPVVILVAVTATPMFLRLAKLKSLRMKSKTIVYEVVIGDVFTLMPAAMVTILSFITLKVLLVSAGSLDVVAEFNHMVAGLFSSEPNSLGFAVAYVSVSQILWFFGIHGPNLLQGIREAQLVPGTVENHWAIVDGNAPLNIFTSQFFDLLHMGGSGTTIGLVIAMLVFSKSPGTRNFGWLVALPALCNVNEPLLYGLPIVLNPIFGLPFLLVPVVNTVIMFLAMSSGFMPLPSYDVAWTTPPIISGYAYTGSINGALVQVLCLAVSVAAYAPCVRFSESVALLARRKTLDRLADLCVERDCSGSTERIVSGTNTRSRLALSLAGDLESALKHKNQLFLEYQPQFDWSNRTFYGAEALLRWNHPILGRIAPPITIRLAEETGLMPELGARVLDLACASRKDWQGKIADNFVLSVNVAPAQILNGSLDATVFAALDRYKLSPSVIKLEITESTILIPDETALNTVARLRDSGIAISLDDFGMGHTSLRYLKALPLDEIKIDRSLASTGESKVNSFIVSSIVDLCDRLELKAVVEGVETEDQLQWLVGLGCGRFQGFYFSRPLPPEECLRFVTANTLADQSVQLDGEIPPDLRFGQVSSGA